MDGWTYGIIDMGQAHLLMNVLGSIGSRLTHLKITTYTTIPGTPLVALRDLLEGCPNLVSLDAPRIQHQSPSLLSRQYHKLIHLRSYYWSTESLAYDNMVNVLTHLPSLVSLDVGPIPDMKVLPMIHQYSPNLKLLAYGGYDSYDMVYDDQQQGLEKFCIGQLDNVYNSDDLIATLVQHSGSLKVLQLAGAIEGNNLTLEGSSSSNNNNNIEFKKLEKLEIEAGNDESLMPLAASTIRRAPHLHTVYINPMADRHEDLFDAIIKLHHLRNFCSWLTTDRCPHFSKFIRHHIDLGERSTLQELEITLPSSTTYWLSAIARLHHLRTLILWIRQPLQGRDYTQYQDIMSTIAMGCPGLEKLALYGIKSVPKGVLLPLHAHPGLRCLRIEAQQALSVEDALAILIIPNLNRLELVVPPDNDIQELLQSKIPVVENSRIPKL